MDLVGPRLVGTPQMLNAHNWAIEKYKSWGIDAKKEKLAQYAERVWNITEGSTDDKAYAAIEKTTEFFHSLGIETKLSDYTKEYEGTAEEIAKRFTDRGWLGLGEHQSLSPEKVEKIVKMAY